MSNSYTREDVENLLVQLKRYRKVIRHYQENDISLDYYRVKSEVKELKTRLAGTNENLLKIEGKYKDCLFDYHKIVEEREKLKLEIDRLKEEIRSNNNSKKPDMDAHRTMEVCKFGEEELHSLNGLLRANLIYQNSNKLSEFIATEKSTLGIDGKRELDITDKDLIKDILQFLISMENWLFMLFSREESGGNMVSDKENAKGGKPIKSNTITGTNQIEQAIIKGAEPDNEMKQSSHLLGDNLVNENENLGITPHQLDVNQVNSTLTNLQGQIIEIKQMLEEKNAKEFKQPKQTQPNFLQNGTGYLKNVDRSREITYRDLKGLSNISQVIGRATPDKPQPTRRTKSNLPSSNKQGNKPVYVRDRKVVKEQLEKSTNSIEKESSQQIVQHVENLEHDKMDGQTVKEEHEISNEHPVVSDQDNHNNQTEVSVEYSSPNQQDEQIVSEKQIIDEVQSTDLNEDEEKKRQTEPENEAQGLPVKEEKVEKEEELKTDLKSEKRSALKVFWEKLTKS